MSHNIDAILRLEVPIVVRLGERPMRLGEVLNLAPGSIIELPKNAEAPLDILVNNKAVGVGRAVKVGENFGLRITAVGDASVMLDAAVGAESDHSKPGVEALAEAFLAGQA